MRSARLQLERLQLVQPREPHLTLVARLHQAIKPEQLREPMKREQMLVEQTLVEQMLVEQMLVERPQVEAPHHPPALRGY